MGGGRTKVGGSRHRLEDRVVPNSAGHRAHMKYQAEAGDGGEQKGRDLYDAKGQEVVVDGIQDVDEVPAQAQVVGVQAVRCCNS